MLALYITVMIFCLCPVDSLYAIYEASTLELWSFMFYGAVDGRQLFTAALFYFMLVVFIVYILQVYLHVISLSPSSSTLSSRASVLPPPSPSPDLSLSLFVFASSNIICVSFYSKAYFW